MGLLFQVCLLMTVGGDVTRSSGWREGGVIIRFSYRVALIQCRKKRYNGVDAER